MFANRSRKYALDEENKKNEKEGKEKSKKKKDDLEDPSILVSFTKLFRYADKIDWLLLVFGTCAALVNGAGMPTLGIYFGEMTDVLIDVAKYGFKDDFNTSSLENPWNSTPSLQNIRASYTKVEFSDSMEVFAIRFALISIVVLISLFFQVLFWEIACERQIYRLRLRFFSQVLRQDNTWYDQNQDGDLTQTLSDDLERIREGIGSKFSFLFQYFSTFVSGLCVGFYSNVELTGCILLFAPLVIGITAVVSKAMFAASSREQMRYGVAGRIASEVLSNVSLVASFGGEEREVKRFGDALKDGRKMTTKRYIVISFAAGGLNLINYGTFAVAFYISSVLISKGHATPGNVFSVFYSVMTGAFSVGNALPYINIVSTALGAASNIFAITDRVPPIDPYSPSGIKKEKFEGKIHFKNVNFSYVTRPDIQVLKNLSFEIQAGQNVAFVGTSGCGKSTIIDLILRFYDVSSGSVLIDGVDVKEYNIEWFRNCIGLVSQEPILFGVSIEENIRYGRDNISHGEVVEAAITANIHSFIKNLPQGYDTEVGEKGSLLSGGQKQRLAIARALVRDPKILLLDEATSALDSQSEVAVQKALDNAMKGRTTIVVAHRLSTVKNADKIFALKEGMVYEEGTHDELMGKKGIYYKLVKIQENQKDHPHPVTNNQEPRERRMSVRRMSERRRSSWVSTLTDDTETFEVSEDMAKEVSLINIIKLDSKNQILFIISFIGCLGLGCFTPIFASLYAEFFNTFTLSGDDFYYSVIFWTGIFCCFAVFSALISYVTVHSSSVATERVISVMRLEAFKNLLSQAVSWFDDPEYSSGRLISCLARDPPMIKAAAGYRGLQVVVAMITIVLTMVIAFWSSWRLASVLTTVVPLIIGANLLEIVIYRRNQRKDMEYMNDAAQVAKEGVEFIKTVQSLCKENLFLERYEECLRNPFKSAKRQAIVYSIIYAVSHCLVYLMFTIGFHYSAKLLLKNLITPTESYRTFFALTFCATFVGQVSSYIEEFSRAKLAVAFVYHLLSLKPSSSTLSDDGLKPEIKGDLRFQAVDFSYPTRPEVKILRGLTLHIRPGQTVALVGNSGCGKSTLVSLIERFYSPDGGCIYLDNTDIKKINVKWMRTHIALVTQDPVLFSSTIKDNIAYGAPNPDKCTLDEIIAAAKLSNIHDFIASLPKGYDTEVGEKGTMLSGGQKQRIAIARALIRDPKILLLDEATSALDNESEKIVQEALDKARKGRTSIIIAHRLSTIQNADVIVVLDNGKVVETGTHSELKNKTGLYSRLVEHQLLEN